MHEIAAIRSLIHEGKSDAEISAIVSESALNRGGGEFGVPGKMFRALSNTVHRAVDLACPVSAHELVAILSLFRSVWEEVVANGDKMKVENACESVFCGIAPGVPVAKVYEQLVDDMEVLMTPPGSMTTAERAQRAEVEKRYLMTVGSNPVVCLAKTSAAVVDAISAILTILGTDGRYQELSSDDAISASGCSLILVMPRQTWAALIRETAAEN